VSGGCTTEWNSSGGDEWDTEPSVSWEFASYVAVLSSTGEGAVFVWEVALSAFQVANAFEFLTIK
jgi:hypothetical protein